MNDEIKWLRDQVSSGNKTARVDLAMKYIQGDGVPLDIDEGEGLLREAAADQDGMAMNNLGIMYANGIGVPRDSVRAFGWLSLAVSAGNREAKPAMDQVERTLSAADKERADAMISRIHASFLSGPDSPFKDLGLAAMDLLGQGEDL